MSNILYCTSRGGETGDAATHTHCPLPRNTPVSEAEKAIKVRKRGTVHTVRPTLEEGGFGGIEGEGEGGGGGGSGWREGETEDVCVHSLPPLIAEKQNPYHRTGSLALPTRPMDGEQDGLLLHSEPHVMLVFFFLLFFFFSPCLLPLPPLPFCISLIRFLFPRPLALEERNRNGAVSEEECEPRAGKKTRENPT